jgi:sugar/nucleoside kinase (ribokinase family)
MHFLYMDENSPYRQLIGVGGMGTGIFFALEGDATLGRNESRPGRLLDVRDYCKLHIVIHYIAKLLGSAPGGDSFHVIPVGNVGDDAAGKSVLDQMSRMGIDTSHVRAMTSAPTLFSVCFQYPDGSGGNITTSNSAAATLSTADIDGVADLLRTGGSRLIALALPEVPLEARHHFLELAARAGNFRAASFVAAEVQPALDCRMFKLLDLVALNQNEAEVFVGQSFSTESPEQFIGACQNLLRGSYPNLQLIISAGKVGAYGVTAYASDFCPAPQVNVASTAGAGDSLLGGVLAALAAGIPFLNPASRQPHDKNSVRTALQFGVLLASYKCLAPHTIHPGACLDTLVEFAHGQGLSFGPEIAKLFVTNRLAQITP